jgi:hypothetical protein
MYLTVIALVAGTIAAVCHTDRDAVVSFAKGIPFLLLASIMIQQKNIAEDDKGNTGDDDGADFHADSPYV